MTYWECAGAGESRNDRQATRLNHGADMTWRHGSAVLRELLGHPHKLPLRDVKRPEGNELTMFGNSHSAGARATQFRRHSLYRNSK